MANRKKKRLSPLQRQTSHCGNNILQKLNAINVSSKNYRFIINTAKDLNQFSPFREKVDQVSWIPFDKVYETIVEKKNDNWTITGYEKSLLER